jgi:hypothetical protein
VLRSRRSAVPGDNVPLAIRRLKMIREEVTMTTTTTTMMMMWWWQHMPEGLIRGRLGQFTSGIRNTWRGRMGAIWVANLL